MRKIAHALFSIFWKPEEDQQLTIVSEYYDHYNQIDQLLQTMPGVLKLIHDDLAVLSKATVKEREADFTSENLFRALVLMQCEGWTLHRMKWTSVSWKKVRGSTPIKKLRIYSKNG